MINKNVSIYGKANKGYLNFYLSKKKADKVVNKANALSRVSQLLGRAPQTPPQDEIPTSYPQNDSNTIPF